MNENNRDKSVFITGANGGLGKETINWLIEDGFGYIVMAGRTEAKAEQARQALFDMMGETPGTSLTAVGGFDMADPAGIEEAVGQLARDRQFDVVFLQAGGIIVGPEYQTVEYGGRAYERTVFQNTLGGHVTLAALHKRNLIAPQARVIVAGGEGARGIPGLIERPDFASPQAMRQYVMGDFSKAAPYSVMNAIGVSKFLSVLWVRKLAEIECHDFSTIWFSPGLTSGTQGLKEFPGPKRWFMENVAFGLMNLLGRAQNPRDGARKYADVIEGKIGRNGDAIGAPEGKSLGELVSQIPMNPDFSNKAMIDEFWNIANEVYTWQATPAAVLAA